MNVAELLNHEIFDLPVSWVGYTFTNSHGQQTCRSYHQFIIQRLKEYQELLGQLDDIDVFGRKGLPTRVIPVSNAEEVCRAVRVLSTGILRTLNAYANGSPSRAYDVLCEALEPADGAGLLQSPATYFYTELQNEERMYYRLRPWDEPLTNPRELFHLPFELRWKTRGYRFSIAGYPSLYAATSPLLALRELRYDGWDDNLYAVKLRAIPRESPEIPIRDVRFFNLRNQIMQFRRRYARHGPYDGQIMGFLVRWPLVMATSVPTGHPASENPGFHEEYVLPQLLLEWVNNVRGRMHKITGISFSSSRVEAIELTREGHYNIVVPAEHPAATGLCSVRTKQFELTAPVALSHILEQESGGQSVAETSRQLEVALDAEQYQRLTVEPAPAE
jgi:hypothetical protein